MSNQSLVQLAAEHSVQFGSPGSIDYDSIPAIRNSYLKEVLRSPAHYQFALRSPREQILRRIS